MVTEPFGAVPHHRNEGFVKDRGGHIHLYDATDISVKKNLHPGLRCRINGPLARTYHNAAVYTRERRRGHTEPRPAECGMQKDGPGERTRTSDPLIPNQVR